MLINVSRESVSWLGAALSPSTGELLLLAPAPGHPLADPGRFMLAGDWHGDAAWARQVIRHAPVGADGRRLIIQLGDFGVWPGGSLGIRSAATDCVRVRPRLFHLPRGTRRNRQGIRFLDLVGATSLDRPWRTAGVDWWPDEELARADLDRAIEGGDCDVMLTHDAPAGIDVPGLLPASTCEQAEVDRADRHRDRLREVVDAVRPARLVTDTSTAGTTPC